MIHGFQYFYWLKIRYNTKSKLTPPYKPQLKSSSNIKVLHECKPAKHGHPYKLSQARKTLITEAIHWAMVPLEDLQSKSRKCRKAMYIRF